MEQAKLDLVLEANQTYVLDIVGDKYVQLSRALVYFLTMCAALCTSLATTLVRLDSSV